MYSVMRRIGDDIRVVHAGIATLVDARNIALQIQRNESNRSVQYFVQAPPRQSPEKVSTRNNSSAPKLSNTSKSNNPQTLSQPRHKVTKYRVVRLQGKKSSAVKGGFQSLDEACEYAIELQRRTSDSTITYQVEYTSPKTSNGYLAMRSHESASQKPAQQKPLTTSQRTGSIYTVVCFRPGNKKTFRGNFQSYDDARDRVIDLQEQDGNPFIKYYIEHEGRLITVSSIGGKSKRKSTPRKEKTGEQPRDRRQRRSHNWETESRTKDSYFPYYDGELLGLGITAQTGHGRRSRKWFNDPT